MTSAFSRLLDPDRLLFGTLVVVMAWLPWPFGSNRPWAWAVAEFAVFGGLGAMLLFSRDIQRAFRRVVRDHGTVLILLVSWLAYQGLQTVDLSSVWLPRLSPATADIYASTESLIGARPYSVAFDRASVVDDLLKNAFYVALFLMASMLAHSRKRLLVLAGAVVAVGLLEACYGLVGYFATDEPVASGSFVNRNHYANFVGLAFAVGLGLLYPETGDAGSAPDCAKHRVRRLFEFVMGWKVLLLAVLAAMAAAVLLSQSRGALASLFASIALMAASGAVLRNDARASGRILGAAVLIGVAGAVWFGTSSLGERLSLVMEESRERLLLWAFTVELTQDYPWLGVGSDNYAWVITSYRDFLDRAVAVTHAHNDYLELMAEQGLVGAVLAGGAVLLVLARMLDGYRRRRDHLLLGILFGSLTASLAFLFHAGVEFVFQVPANAAMFFVVLGMGLAAAGIERRPRVTAGDGPDGPARSETSPMRRSRKGSRRQ